MTTKYYKCNDSGNVLTLVDATESDIKSMQASVKVGSYTDLTPAQAKELEKKSGERAAMARAAADAAAKAAAKALRTAEANKAEAIANMASSEDARAFAMATSSNIVKTPADPEVISVSI